MMLVYMDDSDMAGEGHLGILAGWIAPAKIWAKFSDDWQREVLDLKPPIRLFKPSIAGLKRETEKTRMALAMGLIKQHALRGIVCAVPHNHHRRIMRPLRIEKCLKSPYYLALSGVVYSIADEMSKQGVTDKIDFYLDIQPGQQGDIINAWDDIIASARPEQRKLLKRSPPKFEDDEKLAPLQAAHLLAWNFRRATSDRLEGKPEFLLPWPNGVKYSTLIYTKEGLKKVASVFMGRGEASS